MVCLHSGFHFRSILFILRLVRDGGVSEASKDDQIKRLIVVYGSTLRRDPLPTVCFI